VARIYDEPHAPIGVSDWSLLLPPLHGRSQICAPAIPLFCACSRHRQPRVRLRLSKEVCAPPFASLACASFHGPLRSPPARRPREKQPTAQQHSTAHGAQQRGQQPGHNRIQRQNDRGAEGRQAGGPVAPGPPGRPGGQKQLHCRQTRNPRGVRLTLSHSVSALSAAPVGELVAATSARGMWDSFRVVDLLWPACGRAAGCSLLTCLWFTCNTESRCCCPLPLPLARGSASRSECPPPPPPPPPNLPLRRRMETAAADTSCSRQQTGSPN
jgi:hypothetical protein